MASTGVSAGETPHDMAGSVKRMSDLFCPARFFVARHGDAAYETPRGVITEAGGWLTPLGLSQARELGESLRTENIATVVCSNVARAQETARVAAEMLGVDWTSLPGFEEYRVGELVGQRFGDAGMQRVLAAWMDGDLDAAFPGGESGLDVVNRYREALRDLADQYRGESVLVISHGGVMSLALPRLSTNVRNDLARRQYIPNAVPAEVLVDADSFRIEHWPGKADKSVI